MALSQEETPSKSQNIDSKKNLLKIKSDSPKSELSGQRGQWWVLEA